MAASSESQNADLAAERIPAFIRKIERRILDLEKFDPQQVTDRFNDPGLNALQADIEGTLSDVFGHGTTEYHRYSQATELDTALVAPSVTLAEVRDGLSLGRDKAIEILKSAQRYFEEHLEDARTGSQQEQPIQVKQPGGRKVFVVHGHDHGTTETVARLIENLGLEPVILHEQPNKSRALINKFEDHSADVVFAVVIITPDDVGAAKQDFEACKDDKEKLAKLSARARQNVILELGYFCGKLGRDRVVALRSGQIELPSDYVGVTYTSTDEGGAWRTELAREMVAAGIDIDTGALIGRPSGAPNARAHSAQSQRPPTLLQQADVRVRLEGPARDARFVIENLGPGVARNISLSLDIDEQSESPFVRGDYDRKLPISVLRPGDSLRLHAALTYGTGTDFVGKWSWEDQDGDTHEREGPISL